MLNADGFMVSKRTQGKYGGATVPCGCSPRLDDLCFKPLHHFPLISVDPPVRPTPATVFNGLQTTSRQFRVTGGLFPSCSPRRTNPAGLQIGESRIRPPPSTRKFRKEHRYGCVQCKVAGMIHQAFGCGIVRTSLR